MKNDMNTNNKVTKWAFQVIPDRRCPIKKTELISNAEIPVCLTRKEIRFAIKSTKISKIDDL